MSYEFYKVIHLYSLFLFFAFLCLQLIAHYQEKWLKISTGILTLFIFVSGMGLLARLGVKHAEPWPLWVWIKVLVWGALGIAGPIVIKRFSTFKKPFVLLAMVLLFIAILAANLKF
jgi:hypothetical protein